MPSRAVFIFFCVFVSLLSRTYAQTVGDSVELDPVVVTATRTDRRLSELPQSVSVVSSEQISAAPALSLDDALRLTPSIDLPIAASYELHPTGSPISMRGLGGIRALVLLDGVPLNDPFFGYVQWNRVPVELVVRVEIVSGGGAPLWGNYAMGGVINIITKKPDQTGAELDVAGGSYGTYRANARVSGVASDAAKISVDYSRVHTDGYQQTPAAYLQPVSVPTSFTANNLDATGEFKLRPSLTAEAKIDYHDNIEDLLTRVAVNTQRIWTFTGSVTDHWGDGELTASAFHDNSVFTVATAGNVPKVPVGSAQFVQNQHLTPSNDTGASVLWSQTEDSWLRNFTVGGDLHRISGSDTDQIFNAAGARIRTDLGEGRQLFTGLFAESSAKPLDALEILGSLRLQYFENYHGYDGSPGGPGAVPRTSATSLDPRLSIRYALTPGFALRGAAYRAFRAPTLDNLYRPFSTPFGINYANANLRPETLKGGEVGADFNRPGFRAQVTAYTNTINQLITTHSLTASELPAGFTFGSRAINAGSARARGIEAEATWVLDRAWTGTLGYDYADSIITNNPLDPVSVGQQVSGIPRQRATASLSYHGPGGLRISPQARWVSESYGDNDHTLTLGSHFLMDLSASYPVFQHATLFAQGENIFDRAYISNNNGFQPPRLGTPFTLMIGLHLELK